MQPQRGYASITLMKNSHYYNAVAQILASGEVKTQIHKIDFNSLDLNIKDVISRNLISYRKALGFSQEQFGKLINISLSQYKKYESSKEIIRLDVAHRISLKFGYPNFHLLSGSGYDRFLDAPPENGRIRKVCYLSNSLSDDSFTQLCHILWGFRKGALGIPLNIVPSGISRKTFEAALEENENTIYIAIADGIRALRKHLELSQSEVAELMDVSLNTYIEYEKANQRPRFNFLTSVHYILAMGIHPFYVLQGTYFFQIRKMQNYRIQTLLNILNVIPENVFDQLTPLIDGFFESIHNLPNAVYFPIR